jgi:hypothetical protein
MPNPFTLQCPQHHWNDLLGKSIDGEFLITIGVWRPQSENVLERIGYVEVHHMGPLDQILYPPYTGPAPIASPSIEDPSFKIC